MDDVKFEKTKWEEIKIITLLYYVELGYKNDGFHNGMMFGAEPYSIIINDKVCGFFSVSDSWENNGKMMTSFFISPESRCYGDVIFREILEKYDVANALVPSNDAHLVALAFEEMNKRKTGFEMQAYNFSAGTPKREPEYTSDELFEVEPDEYEELNRLTEGQWDGCFDSGELRFFAIRRDGTTLGYGAIGKMANMDGYVDVGNFTLPQYRRQGVGRSMIILLSRLAVSEGNKPTVGCWYGNKESLPTLRSSGYIPETRIFNVKFK